MGETEVVQPGPAPEPSARAPRRVRNFYFLCLPTLLGTVIDTISMHIHSFPDLSGYILWFFLVWWLAVAPVCTLIAYILLVRSTWKNWWVGKSLALAWTTFILTSVLNLLLALGMITGGS